MTRPLDVTWAPTEIVGKGIDGLALNTTLGSYIVECPKITTPLLHAWYDYNTRTAAVSRRYFFCCLINYPFVYNRKILYKYKFISKIIEL